MYIDIVAYGHENVRCTHKTTLEITKDDYLTVRGDCIIGINSSHSLNDLDDNFKELLRKSKKIVVDIIMDGKVVDRVVGEGHSDLILNHPTDIVIRKSNFICPRTLMINANKGAIDIDREVVEKIRNGAEFIFRISIDDYK